VKTLLAYVVALVATGCAYQGVIVGKAFNAHEMPISLGVIASPKFQLRDSTGNVRSQLVSYDVFERYQVGDYFNDTQFQPMRAPADDKIVKPVHAVRQASAPNPKHSRVTRARRHRHRALAKAHHKRRAASRIAKN